MKNEKNEMTETVETVEAIETATGKFLVEPVAKASIEQANGASETENLELTYEIETAQATKGAKKARKGKKARSVTAQETAPDAQETVLTVETDGETEAEAGFNWFTFDVRRVLSQIWRESFGKDKSFHSLAGKDFAENRSKWLKKLTGTDFSEAGARLAILEKNLMRLFEIDEKDGFKANEILREKMQPYAEFKANITPEVAIETALMVVSHSEIIQGEIMQSENELRLEQLESIIDENIKTIETAAFFVGKALAEISETKIYKIKGYETFENYVAERFGKSRGYAYELINAQKTFERLTEGMNADEIIIPSIQTFKLFKRETRNLSEFAGFSENESANLVKQIERDIYKVACETATFDNVGKPVEFKAHLLNVAEIVKDWIKSGTVELDGIQKPAADGGKTLAQVGIDNLAASQLSAQLSSRKDFIKAEAQRRKDLKKANTPARKTANAPKVAGLSFADMMANSSLETDATETAQGPDASETDGAQAANEFAEIIGKTFEMFSDCPEHGNQKITAMLYGGFKTACGCSFHLIEIKTQDGTEISRFERTQGENGAN